MRYAVLGVLFVFFALAFPVVATNMLWEKESLRVNEGEVSCLSYFISDPVPGDILTVKGEITALADKTSFTVAEKNVTLCFSAPETPKNCILFACERTCAPEIRYYTGSVDVSSQNITVSAPLEISAMCKNEKRSFTSFYIIAVIVLIAVLVVVIRHYNKNKQ